LRPFSLADFGESEGIANGNLCSKKEESVKVLASRIVRSWLGKAVNVGQLSYLISIRWKFRKITSVPA